VCQVSITTFHDDVKFIALTLHAKRVKYFRHMAVFQFTQQLDLSQYSYAAFHITCHIEHLLDGHFSLSLFVPSLTDTAIRALAQEVPLFIARWQRPLGDIAFLDLDQLYLQSHLSFWRLAEIDPTPVFASSPMMLKQSRLFTDSYPHLHPDFPIRKNKCRAISISGVGVPSRIEAH
jgi:hypothetical protein